MIIHVILLTCNTLKEHQTDLTFARVSQVSDWSFTMVVYAKIYFES